MRAGIELRGDYDAARLRGLAKATRNAGQSRRLLALAEIYDGGSRTKAARIGGVGLQTIRDWGVQFKARGPEGLINGKAPGERLQAERQPASGLGGDGGERPDTGDPWRGLLALEGSGDVGLGGVPPRGERDDAEPGVAGSGRSQAFHPPLSRRPDP